MWVCSGSPLIAELCAGSGLDWLLVDAEHSPNGLESILAQLQAIHGYPVQMLVRPPVNDTVVIKQYLDLGVQNLLIPMVNSVADAEAAVAATRYPPQGVRGVGSALARAARWNRIPDYLARADGHRQRHRPDRIRRRRRSSGGHPGGGRRGRHLPRPVRPRRVHGRCWDSRNTPTVRAAVEHCLAAAKAAGKPAGVNAFNPATARSYLATGASLSWWAPTSPSSPAAPKPSPPSSSPRPGEPPTPPPATDPPS